MQRLRYRITTLSSILIPVHSGDPNMTETAEYIPGSNLLGVCAGLFETEKERKDQDDMFYRWFLEGALRFTNAYIVQGDERSFIHYFPAPLSLRCFRDDPKSGVDLLGCQGEKLQPVKAHVSGFCRISGEKMCTTAVATSLHFHHERDRETGSSEKGIIFNYQSIDAGQSFEGSVVGEKSDLEAFLARFGSPNPREIYLGRSRNAQYGKAELRLLSSASEAFVSDVAQDPEADETGWEEGPIVMTLLSDTILYDENGCSTTDLEHWGKSLGVKIAKAFVKSVTVENFRSVWNLKTPSETCLAAGSCFLVEAPDEVSRQRLIQAQKEGIGERRQEGFGRIVLGWQTAGTFFLSEREKPKVKGEKPKGNVPKLAKEIAQAIVQKGFEKAARLKAVEDAEAFDLKSMTKSLAGRLELMASRQSKADFVKNVQNLRKTARDKMEECRNDRRTLLEHVANFKIMGFLLSNGRCGEYQRLALEIGVTPETEGLDRLYFVSFFQRLRKLLKEKEKKEGEKHDE